MRCFYHFANLYTGASGSRLSFQKRYDDICAEWLGGLALHPHKSIIEHAQLGPHLRHLVSLGFLSSYEIAKAKGAAGFILTFNPGEMFFFNYDRFYRRRGQGEVHSEFRPEQREIGDPMKFAYLFVEKRTGHSSPSVAYVNSKDVQTAKEILAEITFDDAPAFLDFALTAARETNFDVQSLGGLRQYLGRFKARQAVRATAKVHKVSTDDGEADRLAHDSYRRHEAVAIFNGLSVDEQQEIDSLARQAAAGFGGSLADAMFATKRRQITCQRYGDRMKSFKEWKAAA